MSLFDKILEAKPLAPAIPRMLPIGEWLLCVRQSSLKRTSRGPGADSSLGAVVLFAVLAGPSTDREHGWGWFRIGEGAFPERTLAQLKQYLCAFRLAPDDITEWGFADLLDSLRGNLIRCSVTARPLKHRTATMLLEASWSSADDLSAAQVGELLDHRALQLPEHEAELASRMLTLGKALGTCEGSPREHEAGSRILDLYADLPEVPPIQGLLK